MRTALAALLILTLLVPALPRPSAKTGGACACCTRECACPPPAHPGSCAMRASCGRPPGVAVLVGAAEPGLLPIAPVAGRLHLAIAAVKHSGVPLIERPDPPPDRPPRAA